ncbi:major facilitator superfamily transporter [Sclerotinia borealis F-4128]|uniref:Major facilitator superfamily transporter n=1 Tax=Sclerotinia borealis (strain F-4128) TaxID=1432307 RepID=W9CX19_SCLBF|nr:major facilitator superfamily transporter [Sclerotinia borealis F-4128]
MPRGIQRSQQDPDKFPTTQLFLLAIVRLAEPIALTSIFPYAWALVKKFQVGSEDDASFYAGLLISAFALAESMTGMYWGGLSDRIGRKPVLLVGCCGTMLSMIMVGFASNIWIALLGRALGGFLNGNIGVIQTMVGEMVTKKEHEPRAYSVMPFVWSIGTIIGPAIGGTFADPTTTFPNIFSADGLFNTFPYLLPNLMCAGLLFISILAGYFLLEETHPDMQPRVSLPDDTYHSEETPLMATADAIKTPAVDLRAETYGTFEGSDDSAWRNTPTKFAPPKIFGRNVVALIIALGIFTYHSMSYDHLLPIFLEDTKGARNNISAISNGFSSLMMPGGLGLSVQQVGVIMSINGVIALFVQAVIFPWAAEFFGTYRLFILVTVLHPIAYLMVPFLVYLPPSFLYTGLYTALFVRNLLSILLYPVLLILIKEATPSPNVLGKVNGLAASAGAACRTVAPPVSGYLYALGSKTNFTSMAWIGSALVASVGAIQCFTVKRSRRDDNGEGEGEGEEHSINVGRRDSKNKMVPAITVIEVDSTSETSSESGHEE